jgi:putative peptidoglycan binding protein
MKQRLWNTDFRVPRTKTFDAKTAKAVRGYQASKGLAQDAQVGYRTWHELLGYSPKTGPNWTEGVMFSYEGCPDASRPDFTEFMSIVDMAGPWSQNLGTVFALSRECIENTDYYYGPQLEEQTGVDNIETFITHAGGIIINGGATSTSLTGKTCEQVASAIKGGIHSNYFRPIGKVSSKTMKCALKANPGVRVWSGAFAVSTKLSEDAAIRFIGDNARKGVTVRISLGSTVANGPDLLRAQYQLDTSKWTSGEPKPLPGARSGQRALRTCVNSGETTPLHLPTHITC